ncbi:Serine/threonine-protein kinase ht1 [Phlyctochytrium bullatum]|nr:Serine/threonine-protein kinase ht1 [Phlyctochytrium bullatum]
MTEPLGPPTITPQPVDASLPNLSLELALAIIWHLHPNDLPALSHASHRTRDLFHLEAPHALFALRHLRKTIAASAAIWTTDDVSILETIRFSELGPAYILAAIRMHGLCVRVLTAFLPTQLREWHPFNFLQRSPKSLEETLVQAVQAGLVDPAAERFFPHSVAAALDSVAMVSALQTICQTQLDSGWTLMLGPDVPVDIPTSVLRVLLLTASCLGSLRVLTHALTLGKQEDVLDLVDARDAAGLTALHHAAGRNKLEVCQMLVAEGADVEARDGAGRTALHLACRSGFVEVVTCLLEAGADVEAVDALKAWTPMHYVAASEFQQLSVRPRLVDLLVRFGSLVDATDDDGMTPLLLAVKSSNLDVALPLVERGANAYHRDKLGRNVLHLIATMSASKSLGEGDLDLKPFGYVWRLRHTCEFFIDVAGVSAMMRDHQHLTPLHVAADNNECWLIDLLVQAYGSADPRNREYCTPLHLAARQDNVRCVTSLLDHGANVNALDAWYWTPLHHAAAAGRTHTVKLLTQYGAHIDPLSLTFPDDSQDDEDDRTPLHLAVLHRHLDAGANIDAKTATGFTPLHYAASADDAIAAAHLLHRGAHHLPDTFGATPLHRAAEVGSATCVKLFLSRGANANTRDRSGRTPLHYAVHAHQVQGPQGVHDTFGALLAAGADVDAADVKGDTALHLAAVAMHGQTVRVLLDAGADGGRRNADAVSAREALRMRRKGATGFDVRPFVAC